MDFENRAKTDLFALFPFGCGRGCEVDRVFLFQAKRDDDAEPTRDWQACLRRTYFAEPEIVIQERLPLIIEFYQRL